MREIDDQMNEIMRRSDIMKKRKSINGYIAGFGVTIAACLLLMVVSVASMANKNINTTVVELTGYGSLIMSAPYMSYVVVALLAFILGILVTLLCKHINELKKLEKENK